MRERHQAGAGRLTLGVSPTARYGIAQRLLVACTSEVPAAMLYTTEDTTGALLRDVARGRLDLAITFCAPDPPAGVELLLLHDEPAVVHLRSEHLLATRPELRLGDLAEETLLVGATDDSRGFSDRVLSAFRAAGIAPHTLADPYPDLGLQAVREGLGVVIYPQERLPRRPRRIHVRDARAAVGDALPPRLPRAAQDRRTAIGTSGSARPTATTSLRP